VEHDINRCELQQEQILCSLEHTGGSTCKLGIPIKGILCDLPLLEWASDAIQTLHRNKHVNLSNKRSEEARLLKVSAADGTDFVEWR